MIKVFSGNDPDYATQYESIQSILRTESNIILSDPPDSDLYLYWSHVDYFAEGGVQLIYDHDLAGYVLKNIVFWVDFDLYDRDLDSEDYHQIQDQMGTQFYHAIYLKLCDIIGKVLEPSNSDHKKVSLDENEKHDFLPASSLSYLTMELSEESFSDCISYGHWPCDSGEQIDEDIFLGCLDISATGQSDYLNKMKKFLLKNKLLAFETAFK